MTLFSFFPTPAGLKILAPMSESHPVVNRFLDFWKIFENVAASAEISADCGFD
jgi:hypothetical protein